MKKTFPFILGAVVLLGSLIAGCDKKDSTSGSVSVDATNSSVEKATSEMKNVAATASEKIKETTEKAGAATKDAVKNLADSVPTGTTAPATSTPVTTPPATTAPVATAPADTAPATTIPAANSPAAAQGLIDKAKSYVSEGKYKESLTSLKQLSDYQLTPDQQKTVDDLKVKAQKYFSSNTVKSISGLFQRTSPPASTNP